jgi:hypothetical protein
MKIEDWMRLIDHVHSGSMEREELYERFIRALAKGGSNSFHTMKIARLIMREFAIEKKV